jgi:exportin-T
MDQEINKIVQAAVIASDWNQSHLHAQALEYLNGIQANASSTWRLALALFVDLAQPGVRKHPTQARFFALRILDDYFSSQYVFSVCKHSSISRLKKYSLEPFDHVTFTIIQQAMIGYIRSEYVDGPAESNATCKLCFS